MCPRLKLTAESETLESYKKSVELKRSEELLAYPEVAVRFYLMHISIAVIAFLWDALVQPF